MTTKTSQKTRIVRALYDWKTGICRKVTMPRLQRIASGKPNGFVACLTKRISELRKEGLNIACHKKYVKGQLHTSYELIR